MQTVITLMQCTSRLYKNDSSGAAPDGLSDCPRPLFSPGSPSPLALARAAAGSALLCTLHYICNFNNGVRPPHHGVCAPRPRVQRCIILDKILGQCETSHSGRPEPGGGSQKAVPPRTDVLNTRVCVSKVWQKSQNSAGANRRPQNAPQC